MIKTETSGFDRPNNIAKDMCNMYNKQVLHFSRYDIERSRLRYASNSGTCIYYAEVQLLPQFRRKD